MYLSFAEYQSMGGLLTETAFILWEKLAEKKIDFYTQNRIKTLETISEDIKLCMMLLVDYVAQEGKDEVASYSNGSQSYSFKNADKSKGIYTRIVEILPRELTCLGVER